MRRKKNQTNSFVQANHCEEQVESVLKQGNSSPWNRTSKYKIIKNEFRMIHCFPNTSSAEEFRLPWHWGHQEMTLIWSVQCGISSTSGCWCHFLNICLRNPALASADHLKVVGINILILWSLNGGFDNNQLIHSWCYLILKCSES